MRLKRIGGLVEVIEDGKRVGYITDRKEDNCLLMVHFDIYGKVLGEDDEIYRKVLREYERFVFEEGASIIRVFSWREREIRFLLNNKYVQRGQFFEKQNDETRL